MSWHLPSYLRQSFVESKQLFFPIGDLISNEYIDILILKEKAEKLKVMQQAIASLEWKETLRKYKSLTVKEKATLDLIDNLRLYRYSCGDNEQEPTHSDPPYLKERYSMSTTPGFKFQPNVEEIFWHLQRKHSNPCQTTSWSPIKECTDLYGKEPGHLPDVNSIKEKEALYYYVPTKKKSGNGDRIGPNGFWRATGNKNILSETGSEIGYRRTLKYFEYPDENHKSSKFGKSTNWMMHEYRLATTTSSQSHEESFEHWTICKITWTGKNVKVTNDFSKEGSIGPSEMVVQQYSSSSDWRLQENLDNNELKMHKQNEGDLKISKIVDSKEEEIAQTLLDEFERWTQEKRGKLREQRMNREIHQSKEVTPCYASGSHSTPSIIDTTHEVETGGVEPQQFENPGKTTKEFGPSISELTSASCFDGFLNSDFIRGEDEIQSRTDLYISEDFASLSDYFLSLDSIGSIDENQSFDPLPIAELPGMEDETLL